MKTAWRITGAEDWVKHERFDIIVKPPVVSPAAAFRPPEGKESVVPMGVPGSSDIMNMIRDVLADRFGLQVHRETRESGVLVLKVGRGPLKLTPDPEPEPPFTPGRDRAERRGVTMERLASILEDHYNRPVIDRTGLTGGFDFRLDYDSRMRDAVDDPALPIDGTGRSLSSALKAIGLTVVEGKGPVEVLVIDSARRPTPN